MKTDKRNSLWKLQQIVSDLQNIGYTSKDVIPIDDVEYFIEQNCGLDDRTIRKYLKLLVKHDFLKPASKKEVRSKKFVSLRTKSGTSTREYETFKGYQSYCFGSRVKKTAEKQLMLKEALPPLPPSIILNEGCDRKNVCVAHGLSSDKNCINKHGIEDLKSSNKEKINNNNTCVTHTYISKTEKRKELSKLEEAILTAEPLDSEPDLARKKCPKIRWHK